LLGPGRLAIKKHSDESQLDVVRLVRPKKFHGGANLSEAEKPDPAELHQLTNHILSAPMLVRTCFQFFSY
jgi:hypothetical protein